MKRVFSILALALCIGCTKKESKPELWIYTSLYKDTIASIQPMLEQKFPGVQLNFYQAGSEEVAAKVNAEELAGGTKADILIFSDRFWFEDMASKKRLHAYKPANSEKVPAEFRRADGLYSAVNFPLMVMVYNSEVVPEAQAPKSFKEMADPKWKGKFTTGSPLASGTNFTTAAFLQKAYGWDYFKALRKNETISEGSNSAVIRRVQTKERPIGWVLMENILRLKEKNIKMIIPSDGAVLQTNVLALVEKPERETAQKIADWFFSPEGQELLTKSFLYGAVAGTKAPEGAPPLEQVIASGSMKWTPEILQEFGKTRESFKEEFAKIMLQ